jgi:hypothetical protein
MEAELRRPLTSEELVHHINDDPTDDRLENLQVVSRAEHLTMHRTPEMEAARIAALRRGDNHPSRLHPELLPRGEAHARVTLPNADLAKLRRQWAAGGVTKKELARRFGLSYGSVKYHLSGICRADV